MAIASCGTVTDATGRELIAHGTTPFPIACYHDDFREMDVPWHWHEELEAAIITEGSLVVAAGNEKFTLHAGEGFFVNSGVLHGCWDMDATGCRAHSLVFHPRLVGGSLDSIFQQNYIEPLLHHPSLKAAALAPSVPGQSSILEAVERAWQECALENKGYEFRVREALSQLIYLLLANYPPQPCSIGEKSQRDSQRIKAMLSFIHANYTSELSVETIAASALVSESECLRCFRSTIGTTPIQYVKQYRIQQAAKQLTATDDLISEIASRCGFQDMSYFSRAFRAYKGCTPSAYRTR